MSSTALGSLEDRAEAALVKRWATDAAGRTVYYPYGPGRRGYLVADAAHQQALRASVARYDDIWNRIKPYAYMVGAPLGYAFYYFVGTHPVVAFALVPAFIAAAVLFDLVLRRAIVGNLLHGLPRVAPTETLPAPLRSLRHAALFFLLFADAIWLVLHVYDLRVAAAAADQSTTTDFYPDISLYVLFTAFFALVTVMIFAGWSRIAAKFSPNRLLFCVFVCVLITMAYVAITAWNLYDPTPSVIIARDFITCRWNARWSDIDSFSLQSGGKGRQYVRFGFFSNGYRGGTSESCEITGLNADYMTVYAAIDAAWRSAKTRRVNASSGGPEQIFASYGLDQIPLGSRRHRVLAALGPPTVSEPRRGILLYVRESAAGSDTKAPAPVRRGLAVYLNANDEVERFAIYSLQNGRIVDEISHDPLTTGFEFSILWVLLARK